MHPFGNVVFFVCVCFMLFMNTHQHDYIVRCFCMKTFKTCILSTVHSVITWSSLQVTNYRTEKASYSVVFMSKIILLQQSDSQVKTLSDGVN